jgi:TRAP-type C4-dicarboxylate transport system permease small subunit
VARAEPPAVRAALAAWHRVECAIAVAGVAAMTGVLVIDVVAREVLAPIAFAAGGSAVGLGIDSAPKVSTYALVAATYAGLGIASARGTHLVPRLAFGAVPARWGPAVDRAADALTAAVLAAVAVGGAMLVRASAGLGLRAHSVGWPLWALQLAIPVGFASAAMRHAAFAAWPALRPRAPSHEE